MCVNLKGKMVKSLQKIRQEAVNPITVAPLFTEILLLDELQQGDLREDTHSSGIPEEPKSAIDIQVLFTLAI